MACWQSHSSYADGVDGTLLRLGLNRRIFLSVILSLMLRDLPVHTRQSLFRCLDVTTEPWLESEPEVTWAKYTFMSIEIRDVSAQVFVNGQKHSLFGVPSFTSESEFCTERRGRTVALGFDVGGSMMCLS